MSDHDGITNFYSDHDKGNLEWGGTVFGKKRTQIVILGWIVYFIEDRSPLRH